MKSEGVNTPPGAPDPNDAIVASHLQAKIPITNIHGVVPFTIFTTSV